MTVSAIWQGFIWQATRPCQPDSNEGEERRKLSEQIGIHAKNDISRAQAFAADITDDTFELLVEYLKTPILQIHI
jgi:hypothetical protein